MNAKLFFRVFFINKFKLNTYYIMLKLNNSKCIVYFFQAVAAGELELLVGLVDYRTRLVRPRVGVCTQMLGALQSTPRAPSTVSVSPLPIPFRTRRYRYVYCACLWG